MAGAFGITLLCSWLFFTCIVQAQTGPIDVTQLGAKPDGSADMSQVINLNLNAKATCIEIKLVG